MKQQFVIETKLMSDALAHREVSKLGYDSVWLSTKVEYRTKHGRRIIYTSLFPSYIFVEFDLTRDAWQKILGCRGVNKILGSTPDKPQALPAGALHLIKERFAAGEFDRGVEPKESEELREHREALERFSKASKAKTPKEGDTVLVEMGCGSGSRPISGVCKLSTKDRIRVLMEYLGGEREIDVPVSRIITSNQLVQTSKELIVA